MEAAFSPVHVVLVSLLVDQMSGLFLIFLVDKKNNCPVSGNFWSISYSFGRPIVFGQSEPDQKKSETDQKFPETGQFFFLVDQKNEKKTGQLVDQETDQSTWTGLICKYIFGLAQKKLDQHKTLWDL